MRGPSGKCADGMRGDAKTAFARLCTVRDGDRAPFEGRWVVASSPLLRLRGLAGRRPDSTVMVFPRCRDVHTLTMRHPLDVAFLDRRGRVIAVHRLVLPGARLRCGRAWAVVERFARPGPWFVRGDVCLLPDAPRRRKPRAPALARTQAAPETSGGRGAVKNETKRRRHRRKSAQFARAPCSMTWIRASGACTVSAAIRLSRPLALQRRCPGP